jgi:hypothetical protein
VFQAIQDFVLNFSSIVWEAMPFIVLGALVAGILEELLPQQLLGKVMPAHPLPAVMVGGLLGLVFPMCECGILVVMRRLLRKGLPLSCCIAYMLAGPILNVVVLLSTYVAFGGLNDSTRMAGVEMVLLRAGLGFVVAVVTGLVVHGVQARAGSAALLKPLAMPPKSVSLQTTDGDAPPERKSVFKRLSNISSTALHDFVDITAFLVLGALLAATAKWAIAPQDIQDLSRDAPYLAIPAMMVLAVVMCLCSEADAFVAASFTEMTASSKLAFLVLGPMLDLKLLLMYTRVFRAKLIGVIVACTVLQVGAYTMILHPFYNPIPGQGGVFLPSPTQPDPASPGK